MKFQLAILILAVISVAGCQGAAKNASDTAAAEGDTASIPSQVSDQVKAVTSNLAGDINKDGIVDDEDFKYFKQIYDRYANGCAYSDANCDGIIDGEDLNYWQKEYGKPRYKLGDLDSDGDVDKADFEKYKANPSLLDK